MVAKLIFTILVILRLRLSTLVKGRYSALAFDVSNETGNLGTGLDFD